MILKSCFWMRRTVFWSNVIKKPAEVILLQWGERVDDGIRMEREKMRFLKERADYIIDTSNLLTRELKQEIDRIFVDNQDFCNMMISVLSFGFKYGIPADADLVFDVRFLPNPYYVDELRPLTGLDDRVF